MLSRQVPKSINGGQMYGRKNTYQKLEVSFNKNILIIKFNFYFNKLQPEPGHLHKIRMIELKFNNNMKWQKKTEQEM